MVTTINGSITCVTPNLQTQTVNLLLDSGMSIDVSYEEFLVAMQSVLEGLDLKYILTIQLQSIEVQ